MSSPLTGIGTVSMWGLTPSIDLLQLTGGKFAASDSKNGKNVCNILLVGQCDARHILHTLAARSKRMSKVDEQAENEYSNSLHINFYIVESCLELYARQIMFLALACQSSRSMGDHEKCSQFMELYGNVLMRPQTKRTLKILSDHFAKIITDENYLEEKFPLLKLHELKFRERDGLVDIMKYWQPIEVKKTKTKTEKETKSIAEYWDVRLRTHLGTRYDSRLNIFDWDYHMKLEEKDCKAKVISIQEYKTWRSTGMAFTEYEKDYTQPNVTLNSLNRKNQFVFSGDIVSGPFYAYGVRSEDASLFEKTNDRYKNKSQDVTCHNLQNIFSGLVPKKRDDKGIANNPLEHANVYLLPLDACKTMCKKQKFNQYFDLLYLAASAGQNLTPDLVQTLSPQADIIVEKPRYSLEFRKEHEEAFNEKIKEFAKNCKLFQSTISDEDLSLNYWKFSISNSENDDLCSGLNGNVQHTHTFDSDSEVASDWETMTEDFKPKLSMNEDNHIARQEQGSILNKNVVEPSHD